MKITDKTVERLSELARLEFDGKAKESIKKDLANVLELVDKLEEVNTQNTPPLTHILDRKQKLRKDFARQEISKKMLLKTPPIRIRITLKYLKY